MEAKVILLERLPKNLAQAIKNNDDGEVLDYFFEHNKSKKYAKYVSIYACLEDTVGAHEMAGSIYHFAINWTDLAYEMAYFHYWRSLELQEFKDLAYLKDFLEISEEPDFDIIPKERLLEVECYAKQLDSDFKKNE